MQQISGKTFYLLFIIDGRQTFKKFTTVHGSKFIDPTQSNLWMNPTHVNLSASDCALYKLNLLTYLLTYLLGISHFWGVGLVYAIFFIIFHYSVFVLISTSRACASSFQRRTPVPGETGSLSRFRVLLP